MGNGVWDVGGLEISWGHMFIRPIGPDQPPYLLRAMISMDESRLLRSSSSFFKAMR
jgi:hypothetical protein